MILPTSVKSPSLSSSSKRNPTLGKQRKIARRHLLERLGVSWDSLHCDTECSRQLGRQKCSLRLGFILPLLLVRVYTAALPVKSSCLNSQWLGFILLLSW